MHEMSLYGHFSQERLFRERKNKKTSDQDRDVTFEEADFLLYLTGCDAVTLS